MKTPLTISTTIGFLGYGMSGAMVYVGAGQTHFRHPDHSHDCECRPSAVSEFRDNAIHGDVLLRFRCNGKKRQRWEFFISYEPDDTYSVRLVATLCKPPRLLAESRSVYNSGLKRAVETMYDDAIKKFNDGFIPLD